MKEILYTIDLVLCLAVAVFGILITIELRNKYRQPYLSSLLFFLVFLSAFGLYGIWGQQFLHHVLTLAEDPNLMQKISRFISFLGIPFLVTAWFMLLKFALDIRFKTIPVIWIVAFFLMNISCIILSWLFQMVFSTDSIITDSSKIFFTSFNLFYFGLAGIILISSRSAKQVYQKGSSVSLLGWLLMGSGVLLSVPFLFSGRYYFVDLFVTLLFFLGMIIPVIFLRIAPLISETVALLNGEVPGLSGYEAFCRQYEISPREAEIILELCQGRSNREIADRLFITLQTVKDHLYRIFIKTEVKSRIQLVNLVNRTTSP
ncbi:MAG: helix-turn-helix transcriptional regulator [Bacteroidota bacterium]